MCLLFFNRYPMSISVLGTNESGHQLCWVAKALIGNQVYFLSGHDSQYTRNPWQFAIQKHHKVLGGRLYSRKFTLDMREDEPVKVITIAGTLQKKTSYIVTQKWFMRIEMWASMPMIAEKGPLPFTPFPEGVTVDNFEQSIQVEKDWFRNAFDAIHLPENPPSATERPQAWWESFTQKVLEFGVSIDDLLVGNTLEVTTGSDSKYRCLITDTGLDVQNGTLLWTLLVGFRAWRLVGAVKWSTSVVKAIKKI